MTDDDRWTPPEGSGAGAGEPAGETSSPWSIGPVAEDATPSPGSAEAVGRTPQALEAQGGTRPASYRFSNRRRSRESGRPRTVRHVVKVHQEVEDRLVAKAAERHVSVAELLVDSALSGGAEAAAVKHELVDELWRVVRVLGKVGVNVNQIARVTNATLETQPHTAAAMEATARTCARIDALLDDLGVTSGRPPARASL